MVKQASAPARDAITPSRERILDAAVAMIRSKGYSATTVDDLCAAAGVTKGSFFHHFGSKEDLAVAAAEHFAGRADALFASARLPRARRPAGPRARVRRFPHLAAARRPAGHHLPARH